jgi:phosphoribosylformylglycinamidine synthase I
MRIAIIQFPGSNCERETMLAVKRAGMEPVEFLWNQSHALLADFAGYIIVGGFSYEDRSRSGAIAALDPLMKVVREQSEKGKPVLGICNGAQILVEAGLVPGLENYQIGMALTHNKRVRAGQVLGTGFYNTWVHMRLANEFQYNAFTRYLSPQTILHLPIAHAEGRFVIPPGPLAEMQVQGMGVFQYCNAHGEIVDEFPVNPNGSINNLAAVSNKAGNVMAMMPHPERTVNGDAIFNSMREYIAKGHTERVAPLYYQPRHQAITQYKPASSVHELIIDLMITDNTAMSVETSLQHLNVPAEIKRRIHWEIECDTPETYEKILQSGILYNNKKELSLSVADIKNNASPVFLVRDKEDSVGQQKKQMLEHHFDIQGIRAIRRGVLWNVLPLNQSKEVVEQVVHSNLLFNPYAHDYYYY